MNEVNMASLIVQNSGKGLDQLIIKRTFEPFLTTKPTGIGTGPAISCALIETNGGRLWLDPDTRSGTKFHFTLPLLS